MPNVVCEEKHMGSRAVVVLCRDEAAARRRFGVVDDGAGIIYTRTGRRFFDDQALERDLLAILSRALERAAFWDRLGTDWAVLDCELMPWSAKAQALIRQQYAAVSAAAAGSVTDAVATVRAAAARTSMDEPFLARLEQRAEMVSRYTDAWRRYCWPVTSVADLKLAPFHVLATEGALHTAKDHRWHLDQIGSLCAADESRVLFSTANRVVDLSDQASEANATAWWEEMTVGGGEGMVIKPMAFIARGAADSFSRR